VKWWLEIQRYHMDSNGWLDVGYNFGIVFDPARSDVAHILEGRGWNGVGGHTVGHNTNGLGVCYLRNGQAGDAIRRAARWVYDEAGKREGRSLAMRCHGDLNATACPGSDMHTWVNGGMLVSAAMSSLSVPQHAQVDSPIITGTAVGIARCDGGYWIVASDGGVFAYGLAQFHGSAVDDSQHPIVGIAGRTDGSGYWLVASDGGVFAYGTAEFKGSMGGKPLNAPVVGIQATSTGLGYYLLAADGGIFAYGDAEFLGSAAGTRRG
jgi:hypothetical protein